MIFERSTNFYRAAHRRLRTGVKDQRHAVPGGDFYQPLQTISLLKLLGRANDLCQLIDCRALLVNRKLRIANDVDEQDMRDLQLNFSLNLGRHLAMLRAENREDPRSAVPETPRSFNHFRTDDQLRQVYLNSYQEIRDKCQRAIALCLPPIVPSLIR